MPFSPAARAELAIDELELLDDFSGELFACIEVGHRVTVLLDFLVPRFAAWASVTLVGEDAKEVVVAQAGKLTQAFQEPEPAALVLRTETRRVGTVHVRGVTEAMEAQAGMLERAAHRAAQSLLAAMMYEREQRVALTFQNAALANDLPDLFAYAFSAVYEAGRAEALVGGDWYDAFALPDGRCVVSIGDVMGSGLRAAVAMANMRQTMRAIAYVHPDPVLMLRAADRTLRDQHPDRYVTTFVAVLDPVMQECTYANAGHPPPFLRDPQGHVRQLSDRDAPLGLSGLGAEFTNHRATLEPGSLLVLYTDGLTEATRNVLEGEARACSEIEAAVPGTGGVARVLHDRLLPGEAVDDVAILCVTIRGASTHRRWRLDPQWSDAAQRARGEIEDELRAAGFAEIDMFRFDMIYAELLANLLRYAPGTADLVLERRGETVVLHATDKGPGYQINPVLPNDLFSERGRGLFIIAQLANDFRVERRAGGGSHARIVLK